MSASTRWGSVLAVMAIAPWMAEMSWGGIPFTRFLLVVLFLGPMYGGAAVLIRETARRAGRGWPTIIVLAAAFGVFQSGVVDQSLFNPDYARYDFQHPVHVDGIDISLYYLVAFVSGHVVVSICVPIAIAEAWSRRPGEPWLARRGAWVVGSLYALATLVNHVGVKDEDGNGFQAEPHQVAAAVGAIVLLIAVALAWRQRPRTSVGVPPVWLMAPLGFIAYLFHLPGENAVSLAVAVLTIMIMAGVVGTWSRSGEWTAAHGLWLAMGAALVGVVVPYLAAPYDDGVGPAAELLADTVAAMVCVVTVGLTAYRRHRIAVATAGP